LVQPRSSTSRGLAIQQKEKLGLSRALFKDSVSGRCL
jgi:hypothetical protein